MFANESLLNLVVVMLLKFHQLFCQPSLLICLSLLLKCAVHFILPLLQWHETSFNIGQLGRLCVVIAPLVELGKYKAEKEIEAQKAQKAPSAEVQILNAAECEFITSVVVHGGSISSSGSSFVL